MRNLLSSLHQALNSIAYKKSFQLFLRATFLCGSISLQSVEAVSTQENGSHAVEEDHIETLDSRMIVRFEKLASHKHGIGSQLPIDIRLTRKGPIEQSVKLSKEGILTITTSFLLEQKIAPDADLSLVPCTMNRSFHLKNFKSGGRFRYEMNRALNAIVLYDGSQSHHLVFSSRSNFEQANTLFSILIEQSARLYKERKTAAQQPLEHKNLSKIFENSGFRWVAIVPRNEQIEASWNAFSTKQNDHFHEMIIWITKASLSEESREQGVETLLKESKNLSPLFLFPLDQVDGWEFSTLPFIGAPFEQLYKTPTQEQSISSKDIASLIRVASTQESIPIRLTQPATALLNIPSVAICRNRDEKQIKKGLHQAFSQEKTSFCTIITTLPKFFEEEIPDGSSLKWLMGVSPQSDDHLRALFFNPPSSKKELLSHLYREYPSLQRICMQPSRIRKKMSIQESLFKSISELKYPELLIKIDQKGDSSSSMRELAFRRISFSTLLALEAGALFGSVDNFKENGIQFAITLAEKLGASWSEKVALEQFFLEMGTEDTDLESLAPISWMTDYIKKKELAYASHISLQEWLTTEYTAYYALTIALKGNAQIQKRKGHFDSFLTVTPKQFLDGSFVIPTGTPVTTKKMGHARPLFGAYLWEKLDVPLHRDGLSLMRIRTKYEEYILKNPKSPWRNKFWEWLAHKQEKKEIKLLSPSTYVSDVDRNKYKAQFENGFLSSPKELVNHEEEEIIFVVDLHGTLYLWKKFDSRSFTSLSFNHASFFSGKPVASAGKMTIRNGKILLLTDHSGHYRPKRKDMLVILKTLQKHGVNIADIAVLHSASSTKTKLWKSGDSFLQENHREHELIANI
ncbi:MAG: hypothetical protein QRY74_04580 [Chlamydia sp.]